MATSPANAVQYKRGDRVTLEDGTDPWLQRPDGTIFPLRQAVSLLPVGDCGECPGGLFAPTSNGPTDQGIERCDQCPTFEGDLEAAVALATFVTTFMGLDVTVWFQPDTE